jgi:hypothetical protein
MNVFCVWVLTRSEWVGVCKIERGSISKVGVNREWECEVLKRGRCDGI